MAAILGLDAALIKAICEQVSDQLTPLPKTPEAEGFDAKLAVVSAANLNSPGQTVISGAVGRWSVRRNCASRPAPSAQ